MQEFSTATGRNVVKRAAFKAAVPVVEAARRLAPDDPETPAPDLRASIIVSDKLTSRARSSGDRQNEVEVYIGPAAISGRLVLNYASFQEFGSLHNPARPYLRPAWDSRQHEVMEIFARELTVEYEASAKRIANKFFKRG